MQCDGCGVGNWGMKGVDGCGGEGWGLGCGGEGWGLGYSEG